MRFAHIGAETYCLFVDFPCFKVLKPVNISLKHPTKWQTRSMVMIHKAEMTLEISILEMTEAKQRRRKVFSLIMRILCTVNVLYTVKLWGNIPAQRCWRHPGTICPKWWAANSPWHCSCLFKSLCVSTILDKNSIP